MLHRITSKRSSLIYNALTGFATCQDTDLSESEESFEDEFHVRYHSKEEEERAGSFFQLLPQLTS
jgi:hypothetical protein